MKIVLEVSSSKIFEDEYGEVLEDLKQQNYCSVVEDRVGYGVDQTLVVGVLFVMESIKSGITYDLIKPFLLEAGNRILAVHQAFSRRPGNQIVFYLEDEHEGRRYKLSVNTDENTLEVDLPGEEQIRVRAHSREIQ